MMICSQCATKLRTPVTNELESLPEATSKRIKDLLASNVAPPERERESLSDLMSRTQNYATSLDTRIAELRATLEHLLYEKSTTEQRLCDLKTTLHPIRVVPPEIFAQIFDEAVSDAALIPLEKVRDGKFANSIYSSSQSCVVPQVSSAWRRTALKTQRLWRFVHVSFDRYPRNLSTSLFLNRFLARSAEHTLHVMLHATVDHPALTVLLMTSSRWQTAAISLPPSLYHSWDAPDLAFHSLTRCHLHVQVDGLQNWSEAMTRDLTRIPLECPQLQVFSSDTAVAWSQLFSWRLKVSPLQRFEQIGTLDENLFAPFYGVSCLGPMVMISSPPSLTSALFYVVEEVPDIFYHTVLKAPLRDVYPNLRALRLVGTSAGYRDFLSRFPLPCLETLSFEDSERGGQPTFPFPLAAPTGQYLTQLKVLLQNANDTNSLVALLRTTPRLGQLVLRARTCFDISQTIHSILVDEKDLLPDLADLAITSMDPDGVEVSDAFVEAIQHRRSGAAQVVKLQEVSVDFVANIDADVVAAFNGLLSDGLRGALTFRCSGMDHTVDMYLG